MLSVCVCLGGGDNAKTLCIKVVITDIRNKYWVSGRGVDHVKTSLCIKVLMTFDRSKYIWIYMHHDSWEGKNWKYLGVVLCSKLSWSKNIRRRYCFRKLETFEVSSDILSTFYDTVICSLIIFWSVCLDGNVSKCTMDGRLEKTVRKAGQLVERAFDSFQSAFKHFRTESWGGKS